MKKNGMFFLCAIVCSLSLSAEAPAAPWGAQGAATAVNPGIADMLRYAIEDEYFAHAEYDAILEKFGTQRPFSNIIAAEVTHIGWLRDTFTKLKLTVPEDRGMEYIAVPSSLDGAFKAGVQAEIDNIAMYDSFIAQDEVKKSENKYLKDLFVRLRDASKNHLAAFRKN